MAGQVSALRGTRRGSWFDRWITEFAERLDASRYRITLTQAELARREGVSPGTVQERIRRLEAAGVVVSRNPLVVDLGGTEAPSPTPDGNARCREGITALVQFMEFHGVTPALREALAEMVAALDARPVVDEDPRDGARLWGVPAADPRLPSLDGGEVSIQSPLLLAVPSTPNPRPIAARRPRQNSQRGVGEGEERVEWDRMVQDLSDACRLRGLPDYPHSADALWRVVAQVSGAERAAAIGRVAAQVRAGDPIKDPFGLLYSVIEARQPEYLDPAPDTLAPPPRADSSRPAGDGLQAQGRDVHTDQLHRPLVAEIERCGVCGKLLLPGNCTCGVPVWRPPSLSGVLPSQGQDDASVAPAGEAC